MEYALPKEIDELDMYGEWERTTGHSAGFSLVKMEYTKQRSYRKPPASYWKTIYWRLRPHPITWLRRCDSCDKLGTPKRINDSHCRYGNNFRHLCFSCLTKFRTLEDLENRVLRNRTLINKLNKEIKLCQR